jgi:hypothetical protein
VVLTDDVVMSNAAYVINQPMARLLLSHFLRIDTTSDVFVHRKAETWDGVRACTVKPLLATELSFNRDFAQFVSRIHPKGISGNDELRKQSHFQRAVNESDYRQQRNGWISRPE